MPSSTSGSRVAALGLGMALFAIADRAIWTSRGVARYLLRHEPEAASGDTFGVAARIRLMDEGRPGPVVLLGSSVVREGLDCDILEASPGATGCVNLGIGGGSPLDMLYISRELGTTPRTVVIGLFPGVIAKPPKSGFIDSLTVRALSASGALWNSTPGDWRLLGSGLLQTLSPTLRHRDGLRAAFSEPSRPASVLTAKGLPSGRRTTDAERKPPEYFANRIGRIDKDFALSRFTPTQELALEWLIAREEKIASRVVVVDFPTRPGFQTVLPPEALTRYSGLIERLRSRSNVRLVESRELGPLSENDFIDFTHVDSNGRRLISERLRALLKP